jgi:tetraacyldisaccharide 4'-kinase
MKRLDQYWYSQNPVAWLLLPLTALFCVIRFVRKECYSSGLFKSFRLKVPVIIIGNISVGGTGKTPLLIELCSQLRSKGYRPGVITRGYGGHAQQWPQLVTAQSSAYELGDEPVLIASRSHCPVVAGPDRVAAGEYLLEHSDCDVILSDDGLQHYRLRRDAELVVIDAQRMFGNGFCMPSGPLREPVRRLASVDLSLLNGATAEQTGFVLIALLCESLASDQKSRLISDFASGPVHAVAGIGNPGRFFSMLREQGLDVIEHPFADHYVYKPADLQFDDDYPILMTAKDAVKCTDFDLENHWSVPVDVELTASAQAGLDKIIQKVCHG